jgi:hypothetical protein
MEEVINFGAPPPSVVRSSMVFFSDVAMEPRQPFHKGEYLIQSPGAVHTRLVCSMLRLRAPFVVEISA